MPCMDVIEILKIFVVIIFGGSTIYNFNKDIQYDLKTHQTQHKNCKMIFEFICLALISTYETVISCA